MAACILLVSLFLCLRHPPRGLDTQPRCWDSWDDRSLRATLNTHWLCWSQPAQEMLAGCCQRRVHAERNWTWCKLARPENLIRENGGWNYSFWLWFWAKILFVVIVFFASNCVGEEIVFSLVFIFSTRCQSSCLQTWDPKKMKAQPDCTLTGHLSQKCVSNEFGLTTCNKELRCFLPSRRLVGKFGFFSTDEDCQEFLWWRKWELSGLFVWENNRIIFFTLKLFRVSTGE